MADINVERKGSGSGTTWILAVLSVIAVGGFLWWLSITAKPTEVKVAEASADSTQQAAGGAPVVTLADLAARVDSLQGKTIQVRDLQVASLVGSEAFWIQLPNQVPFLVKLDSAAVATGAPLQTGSHVTVTGTVHAMSDSVLSAWQQQGAITDAQKNEASFATAFLAAHRAQVQAAGPAQGGTQPKGQGE